MRKAEPERQAQQACFSRFAFPHPVFLQHAARQLITGAYAFICH